MGSATKIVTIGNSSGIIVPKELMSRLKLERGDSVYVSEIPGGFQVTTHDEDFSSKLEAADRVIRRYREALKKLAE